MKQARLKQELEEFNEDDKCKQNTERFTNMLKFKIAAVQARINE